MSFPQHWLHSKIIISVPCHITHLLVLVLTWWDPIWKSMQRGIFTEIFCRFLQQDWRFHKTLSSLEGNLHFIIRIKLTCNQIFLNLDAGNLKQLTMLRNTFIHRNLIHQLLPCHFLKWKHLSTGTKMGLYILLATVFIGSTDSCEKSLTHYSAMIVWRNSAYSYLSNMSPVICWVNFDMSLVICWVNLRVWGFAPLCPA